MKLYLDDERPTPEGWVRAYTAREAIKLLKTNDVSEISLDHDLGDESVSLCGNGYDVISWIEVRVALDGYIPPIIHIHTSNPSARIKMIQARDSINAMLEDRLCK